MIIRPDKTWITSHVNNELLKAVGIVHGLIDMIPDDETNKTIELWKQDLQDITQYLINAQIGE
jgi:hypothetical protein